MTRLPRERVGGFLEQQAEELTRIWRLARADARRDVFPGLLDDLVQPFFSRAGTELAAGSPPEAVWRGLAGLVRWPPSVSPAEHTEEWALVLEVLRAACESVNAAPEAAAWLAQAAAAAEAGTAALAGRDAAAPEGIVVALVFTSAQPRMMGAQDETI
ncbi:MAG TPA: hypothetical protein VFP65_03525 [Anaeromyxobacteraceae bacterium]|nr:hypothetical protein [Anaeromyxobacteraceae bacterium]